MPFGISILTCLVLFAFSLRILVEHIEAGGRS